MKKVLIICHDFYPLNTAGSQRPTSWFEYFPEFNIHPVVVTKKWSGAANSLEDKYNFDNSSGETVETQKSTLIRCVPTTNRRNELIVKHGLKKKIILRKLLTVRDLIYSYFLDKNDENEFLYEASRQYIIHHNDVSLIIVSAEPFILFKYGNKLSKEFGIPWVADYRDEWRKNYSLSSLTLLERMLKRVLNVKEKVWTRNCAFFTTTSPPWVHSISKNINKSGYVIRNGIDLKTIPKNSDQSQKKFILFYAGTIYNTLYLEILFKGLKEFFHQVNLAKGSFTFKVLGIELNKTKGSDRFIAFAKDYPEFIRVLPAVSYSEVLKQASEASVFLNLVAGSIGDGIYNVKLYEYLAFNKPIINIESDYSGKTHEFSDYLIESNEQHIFSDNLEMLYQSWLDGKPLENRFNHDRLTEFDRKFQCKKFSEIIHDYYKS